MEKSKAVDVIVQVCAETHKKELSLLLNKLFSKEGDLWISKKREFINNSSKRRAYELQLLFNSCIKRNILQEIPAFNNLLDFGCGNSDLASCIAEKFNTFADVSANIHKCDISSSTLNALSMKECDEIIDGKLPYLDACFDIITCYQVLHHIPLELLEIELSEISRTTIKGGLLVVREHNTECEQDIALIELEHLSFEIDFPIYNLKSCEEWINILNQYSFTHLYTQTFSKSNPTKYVTMLFRKI